MNSTLVYIIVIIVVSMIILSIDKKNESIHHLAEQIEGFDTSSQEAVGEGASTYYHWGYHPIVKKEARKNKRRHKKEKYCVENVYIEGKDRCRRIMDNCPIYDHPDIDKFVLKSSIPPRHNMRNFAKKSDLCPCVDMKNYIKKSEIKPCPDVDLRDYVLKSQIPSCVDIKCPKCPVCPKIPEQNVRKEIIKIEEHPEFGNYVRKERIEELREKLRQCRQNNTRFSQGDNGVTAYNNQYCPV